MHIAATLLETKTKTSEELNKCMPPKPSAYAAENLIHPKSQAIERHYFGKRHNFAADPPSGGAHIWEAPERK
jgi:hypothetical protein